MFKEIVALFPNEPRSQWISGRIGCESLSMIKILLSKSRIGDNSNCWLSFVTKKPTTSRVQFKQSKSGENLNDIQIDSTNSSYNTRNFNPTLLTRFLPSGSRSRFQISTYSPSFKIGLASQVPMTWYSSRKDFRRLTVILVGAMANHSSAPGHGP